MFFVPSQVYSRDRCHFSLVFQKLYKGTPGFKQGTSWTAAECSTTKLYPRCIQTQNITANTLRLFEHCYNVFCSESSVLSRSMSFFSSLLKIIQGSARVRTRDLSDCSRMLYHWAISPLHTDSIPSLQTRAGCLSTVTMCFVPSQVFSRNRCHFSLVFQKFYKGTPGFEPGTSRTAAECSTTELYPRCIQIQKHHSKHAQVVRALLQCFLFRVKCSLAIDVIFSSLSKIIQGDTRVRTSDLSDCNRMIYHRAISPLHTDSIPSLQTRAGCLSTVTMFFVPSQVFSCDRSPFFSSLSKIIQGDTRVRTRDLSDCSRMLYHWAVSPLHAYSITSPQTRAGCLSTVTMFFVPSQVYSRDRCPFSLVFQKLYKGTPWLRPGTSPTAAECSTTELYPRCIQIQ